MAKYAARIRKEKDGGYFALIVGIDRIVMPDKSVYDHEWVIPGYKGRHFLTQKAAIRSTDNYMEDFTHDD